MLRGYCTPRPRFVIFCVFLCHRKEILRFMHGSDSKVIMVIQSRKEWFAFLPDLRISRVERLKVIFSFFTLKKHFKIDRINS